jgi:hypothetical protein
MIEKERSLFDFLDDLTVKKTKWEDISQADRKKFSVYMINRFLSMNMDYTETINFLQQYTIGTLTPEFTYKLYLDVLPKKKSWSKYIKNSGKGDKYNPELISLLSKNMSWSVKETNQNLKLLMKLDNTSIREYLEKYGYNNAQINKML